jgi:hypothetical protein
VTVRGVRGEKMITKRDIMQALGESTTEDRFLVGLLVGVGLGAIVGGAVALFLSPRSGSEMRQMVGEKLKRTEKELQQ